MTNGVTSGTSTPNNAASSSGAEENLEPSAKRRKVLRGSAPHPAQSGQQLNGDEDGGLPHCNLVSELVVFDKHSRCFLTEGEYELVLAEAESSSAAPGANGVGAGSGDTPRKGASSWEQITVDKNDKVRPLPVYIFVRDEESRYALVVEELQVEAKLG